MASGDEAERLLVERPDSVVSYVVAGDDHAVLYDAMQVPELPLELLRPAARNRRVRGRNVSLVSDPIRGSSRLRWLNADTDVSSADA